ncbi:LysR family transcriptional regulator [Falsiphaeobacter marinintestinus]|uniref:LysR family transcriptional regulator n=1 Tax=Falsiphaeobacter marinintestinus TaxID=1492905 RepID=UPI0016469CAB|nr:LysR family transcriptional regulator [Phaeobacter marinintestinus]
MQDLDWDDLKHALAVARAGSLAEAARTLGVNETTVARRIRALEAQVGAPLFVPGARNTRHPTETGAAVIRAAERVEQACLSMRDDIGLARGQLSGVVRITSVPMIVNRILVPHLPAFLHRYPGLNIELVPDSRNLSLTRREADLALRLGRPQTGGMDLKTRKLGQLRYDAYGRADAPCLWITYDDAHAHLPQARWLAARPANEKSAVRVCDIETAYEAVAEGLGKTLLPSLIGDADPRLQKIADQPDLPTREVWLVSHADPDPTRAITAAKSWLASITWADAPPR